MIEKLSVEFTKCVRQGRHLNGRRLFRAHLIELLGSDPAQANNPLRFCKVYELVSRLDKTLARKSDPECEGECLLRGYSMNAPWSGCSVLLNTLNTRSKRPWYYDVPSRMSDVLQRSGCLISIVILEFVLFALLHERHGTQWCWPLQAVWQSATFYPSPFVPSVVSLSRLVPSFCLPRPRWRHVPHLDSQRFLQDSTGWTRHRRHFTNCIVWHFTRDPLRWPSAGGRANEKRTSGRRRRRRRHPESSAFFSFRWRPVLSTGQWRIPVRKVLVSLTAVAPKVVTDAARSTSVPAVVVKR